MHGIELVSRCYRGELLLEEKRQPVHDQEKLVEEAKKGNVTAFARLYEIYFDKVFRYLAVRLGDLSEAEDLAQEVFVKVLWAMESFHWEGRPFSAWLFRIAHNVMVDHLRHKRPREVVPIDDIPPIPGGDNPAESAELVMDSREVRLAVNKLTAAQQQVILLRFVAELSIAETATTMNKNENAIKALQHAALVSLRKVLLPKLKVEG